jgi:protein TonB
MSNIDTPVLADSPVTATDRLALTLFFALVLHAMVILGITFGVYDDPDPEKALPTLDITIATRTTPPPDEADYLAQTSQDGGGNVSEKIKPTMTMPERAPVVEAQQPVPAPTQVITALESDRQVKESSKETPETAQPEIKAAELIERMMEMDILSEQISESRQAYAQRPRQVFISARTQEYKYANYMSEWVKKVERVGNLNYPAAARRARISGKLMMEVALNADGTVHEISILRPSGEPIIDEAAKRIVNLAAPFPPFPPEILENTDILNITRTWEFSTSNTLSSH